MNWSEHVIARAIALQTLARKCVVLVDNCKWTGHECDVLGITTDLRIIDVEVKISRGDLKADAKKEKWWRRTLLGYSPDREIKDSSGRVVGITRERIEDKTPLDWPRKVWKHYYALPADIWKPELIDSLPSEASGVLLFRERRNTSVPVLVECVRRPKPNKDFYRLSPEQVMDIARLANLRMWEAYAQRDSASAEASRLHRSMCEVA